MRSCETLWKPHPRSAVRPGEEPMKRKLALPLPHLRRLRQLRHLRRRCCQSDAQAGFRHRLEPDDGRRVRTAGTPAPPATRIGAIVQSSVFDALNGIERKYTPIHVQPAAPPGASRQAAVVEAAYEALVTLFPAQKATFDAQLAASLARSGAGRTTSPSSAAWPGASRSPTRSSPGGPATASTRRLRRTCSAPIPGTGSRHRPGPARLSSASSRP